MNAPSNSVSLRQSHAGGFCPRCGAPGKPVKLTTLQSLLKPDALARTGSAEYRFCPSERCDVVYFEEAGGQMLPKSALNVRVGVKETVAPRPVCYCFDHTVEEIDEEVRLTGKTTVLDEIKARMKEACWCETKNPQGSCCLSTITRYVKAALERDADSQAPPSSTRIAEDYCIANGQTEPRTSDHSTGNAERFAMIGSFASAAFASACCWLPLLLLAVGVSGGAVGAAFGRYRPILLGVSFAMLGVAFYFAHQSRPKLASFAPGSAEIDSCDTAEGDRCARTATAKRALHRFNRSMLWVVTVLVLAFAFIQNYLGSFSGNRASRTTPISHGGLDSVAIAIEGMTCEACAKGLQKELTTLPGIAAAEVSYNRREAIVHLAKGNSTPVVKLLAAIGNAGYRVSPTTVSVSLTESINQPVHHENQNENKNHNIGTR